MKRLHWYNQFAHSQSRIKIEIWISLSFRAVLNETVSALSLLNAFLDSTQNRHHTENCSSFRSLQASSLQHLTTQGKELTVTWIHITMIWIPPNCKLKCHAIMVFFMRATVTRGIVKRDKYNPYIPIKDRNTKSWQERIMWGQILFCKDKFLDKTNRIHFWMCLLAVCYALLYSNTSGSNKGKKCREISA